MLLSLSAIKLSDYRAWEGRKHWKKDSYKNIFEKYTNKKNAYRIYLPLNGKYITNKIKPLPAVVEYLKSIGYEIEDYVAGIAIKAGQKKNPTRIGKLLKSEPDLLQKFVQHKTKLGIKKESDLLVVISRHPYDIMGMSTDRGWTSCTNLGVKSIQNEEENEDGANAEYVYNDVKQGHLIAYLISKTDLNIQHPKARVRILRYDALEPNQKGQKFIFYPHPEIYGTEVPKFIPTILTWIDEINGFSSEGIYCTTDSVDVGAAKLLTKIKDHNTLLTYLDNGLYGEIEEIIESGINKKHITNPIFIERLIGHIQDYIGRNKNEPARMLNMILDKYPIEEDLLLNIFDATSEYRKIVRHKTFLLNAGASEELLFRVLGEIEHAPKTTTTNIKHITSNNGRIRKKKRLHANSTRTQTLKYIAGNENINHAAVERLVDIVASDVDGIFTILNTLAINQNVAPNTHIYLFDTYKDTVPAVAYYLAASKKVSKKVLKHIIDNLDDVTENIRLGIRRGRANVGVSNRDNIINMLVRNPIVPSDFLIKKYEEAGDDVTKKVNILNNENVPLSILDKAIVDKDGSVRIGVFNANDATPKHISAGLNDHYSEVREQAALHKNITKGLLLKALGDPDYSVGLAALANIQLDLDFEAFKVIIDSGHSDVISRAFRLRHKITPKMAKYAFDNGDARTKTLAIETGLLSEEVLTSIIEGDDAASKHELYYEPSIIWTKDQIQYVLENEKSKSEIKTFISTHHKQFTHDQILYTFANLPFDVSQAYPMLRGRVFSDDVLFDILMGSRGPSILTKLNAVVDKLVSPALLIRLFDSTKDKRLLRAIIKSSSFLDQTRLRGIIEGDDASLKRIVATKKNLHPLIINDIINTGDIDLIKDMLDVQVRSIGTKQVNSMLKLNNVDINLRLIRKGKLQKPQLFTQLNNLPKKILSGHKNAIFRSVINHYKNRFKVKDVPALIKIFGKEYLFNELYRRNAKLAADYFYETPKVYSRPESKYLLFNIFHGGKIPERVRKAFYAVIEQE